VVHGGSTPDAMPSSGGGCGAAREKGSLRSKVRARRVRASAAKQ